MNHLTSYLSTVNAGQRDRIIQQAKFPKKIPVSAYGQARTAIQKFWGSRDTAEKHFETYLAKLDKTAKGDPERRDEALRCIRAIDAFMVLHGSKKWKGLTIHGGPIDLAFKRQAVTINTRLDCQVFKEKSDGETVTGGITLLYANTPDTRKNIEVRRRQAASLIRWSLEENGQIDPAPSLCMSFDIFGGEVIRSPDAKDQFRNSVDQSCREVALKWNSIAPPKDYDGPAWK